MRGKGVALSAAAVLTLLCGGAAQADAIDGTWCSPGGLVLSIEGPEITTPGKHKVIGNYRRHAFAYVVPAGEDPVGETVEMQLLNEDTMDLKLPDREIETWRRCEIIS